MPQNVIAAFACILSVDLMGITLFFQLFLLRFFCCCCKNVLLCCWFNPFFFLCLSLESSTLEHYRQWIELVCQCAQPLVSSHLNCNRDTHTNTHSFSVNERERSRHLYKLRIVITKYSFEKRIRTHTHTHTQNWLQSDWLLFTLYARTHSKCQLLQPTGVLAFFHSIRNQFCLGRNHEDCYERVIYVS